MGQHRGFESPATWVRILPPCCFYLLTFCRIPKRSEWLNLSFNRAMILGKLFYFVSLGFPVCKMGVTIELASLGY